MLRDHCFDIPLIFVGLLGASRSTQEDVGLGRHLHVGIEVARRSTDYRPQGPNKFDGRFAGMPQSVSRGRTAELGDLLPVSGHLPR